MKFHTKMYGWDYVWRDFADEFEGEVLEINSGSKSTIVAMHIPLKGNTGTVTFTPYVMKGNSKNSGTTVALPYEPRNGFSFAVYNEKVKSGIGKLFGVQDVLVGDQEFDKKFVVQANDVTQVQSLFEDTAIRDALMLQPELHLGVIQEPARFQREWSAESTHHVLTYSQSSLIEDFTHLKDVLDLVARTASRILEAAPQEELIEVAEAPLRPMSSSGSHLRSPLLENL